MTGAADANPWLRTAQAALAFDGPSFRALSAGSMSAEDIEFSQKHVYAPSVPAPVPAPACAAPWGASGWRRRLRMQGHRFWMGRRIALLPPPLPSSRA